MLTERIANKRILGSSLNQNVPPEFGNIDLYPDTPIIEISIDRVGPQGASAYAAALTAGFVGTEEEWLASLNGYTPQKGVDYFTEADKTELVSLIEIANDINPDLFYTHDQIASSALWTVTHNLGKYPSVMVVDSGDNVVTGDVKYISANELTVTFAGAFSGKAYLN